MTSMGDLISQATSQSEYSNLLESAKFGIISVKSYGAVGDGVTDDTTAIQNAIDACVADGGGVVFFPYGTYYVSSELTVSASNVKLVGFGAVVYSDVGSAENTIYAYGTIGDSYEIQSAISVGATTFTLTTADAANISEGDYLKVETDEAYYDSSYTKGELVKVESVNTGTGVITIEGTGFILSYSVTGKTPAVKKITFIENISIEGIEFHGQDTDDGRLGINLLAVKNARISKCNTHDFDVGIKVDNCLDVFINNNKISECYKSGSGYGCEVEGVTQRVSFSNNMCEHNRHSFTTTDTDGVCMHITVSNNIVENNTDAGLDTHGNSRYVSFFDNTVNNCVIGIDTRSPHSQIKNNTITNSYGLAIYAFEAGGINIHVEGNTIDKCSVDSKDAINLGVTATTYETNDYMICRNNIINKAANGRGVAVNGEARIVDVSGNKMKDIGYTFIYIGSGINIKANNNMLISCDRSGAATTYGIDATNTADSYSSIEASNNTIFSVYNGIKITNPTIATIIGNELLSVTTKYAITATNVREDSNFTEVYVATTTWDPGNLVDGAGETKSLTVTGAALGDFVLVSAPYDLQDITCTAYVQATDTVEIRLQNESGVAIDLGSGTWKVKVIKA